MNIDFHVHGILSKKLFFDSSLFLQGIEYAKNNDLQGFVLCEHFNALDIDSTFSFLKDNYKYQGDKYIVNDFSVFLGMEVDIKNGGHVIVCGNRDAILSIQNKLKNHIRRSNFIEFEELLNLGESLNCLMIGAHPLRDSHKLYLQPQRLLKRLHALDLNTKDIYKKGEEQAKYEIFKLSKILDIPCVCGSDSHYPVQLGTVKTCFNNEISTIEELKSEISKCKYNLQVSKDLNLKVYTAKVTKNKLKKKIRKLIAKEIYMKNSLMNIK